MYRLIYFVPTWALFLALRTVAIVLGWLLVPIAAAARAYEPYNAPHWHEGTRVQYRFTWPFMWLWDNEEDGIADRTYWDAPNMFLAIVYWSALRNPANNLRYVPWLSVLIDSSKVKYIGSLPKTASLKDYDKDELTFWSLTWQGVYSNIRVHFKMGSKIYRFWLGWKIYPEDKVYPVTGHRATGAGFATQFKRIWPKS